MEFYDNYIELRKTKRELLSYLKACETCNRFLRLKLTPPDDVVEKVNMLADNGITVQDIHNNIDIISYQMKLIKGGE